MGGHQSGGVGLQVAWTLSALGYLGFHIAVLFTGEPAVDLALRIQEARYFRAGIDPYLVMVGELPAIPQLGGTTGYSFVSYVLMLPLTFVRSTVVQELLFAIFEFAVLAASLRFLQRIVGELRVGTVGLVSIGVFGSVFFLQHLWNLNYAMIGASAAVMALSARRYGRTWQGALGLVLVAVKPSYAIPVVLVLAARRDWRTLLTGGVALGTLLVLVSFRLGRDPVSIVLNAARTADRFSTGYENGLLYLVWEFVEPIAVPLGVVLCLLIVILIRRYLSDDRIAISIALALGVAFFYNHVHAWMGVFPLLVVASADARSTRDARRAVVLLLGFLLIPRLLQFVPVDLRDFYMLLHNAARFGALIVAVALIARSSIALGASGEDADRTDADSSA